MIEFGVVLTGMPADAGSGAQQLRRTIELAQTAESQGFQHLVVGQHFLGAPYRYLQAVPLIARLGGETSTIRIATGILLLSLLQPVEVAEQLATLDVMTDGRLTCGFGLGYRDAEFQAFGIERSQRVGRQVEALQVIEALWTGQKVTHHGRYFDLEDVATATLPVQSPRPPIWIAAMTETSAQRAIDSGHIPYLGPRMPIDVVADRVARTTAALGAGTKVPLRRELFVSHDQDVREQAMRHIGVRFDVYREWGLERDTGGPEASLADYLGDRIVAGSVAECVATIRRYEELGVGSLMFRCSWPELSHQEIIRMITLVGEEIIPEFA